MKVDWKFLLLIALLTINSRASAFEINLPIRDLFAGFAMCGYIARSTSYVDEKAIVSKAYPLADLLLKERNKK